MAVVVTMELATATTEQYEQVVEKMNLGGKTAPNGIFHVCAEDPAGGIFICDTWESAEAFQAFADSQIGPLMASVGVTDQPKITVRPVHSYLERG
jgi:hypothetical protein